ncbi:MAG: VanZ family protein [bacterium]|nr:VanZ family protein [bacterium]
MTGFEVLNTTSGRKRIKWFLVVAYAILIFFLSSLSTPSPLPIPDIFMADKLIHFIEYAIFAFLLFSALYEGMDVKKAAFLSVIMAAIYGATDEFHQYFVAHRDSDLFDLLADSLGGVAGAASGVLLKGGRLE